MELLDAATLLYLSKTLDPSVSLLDCAHQFQETRERLAAELREEQGTKMKRDMENNYPMM